MTESKSTHYDFDAIVVGSGLTGLLITRQLRSRGYNVALFEQKESLGGQYRKIETQKGELPSSLNVFSQHPESESWARFLTESLGEEVRFQPFQLQPKTYENAQIKNFVGFGDQNFKTINFLADYNTTEWLKTESAPSEWIEKLLHSKIEGSPVGQSLHEVTAIERFEKGYKVTVNGGKTYACRQVFFTPAPSRILPLVPHESLPNKFVTRLAKAHAWTKASLHLAHNQNEYDDSALYFLLGSKPDFEPCLGRFFKSDSETGEQLTSYWFTLISPEQSEDNEYLGNSIKNIKKFLKRVFPELAESIVNEKITISLEAFGDLDLNLKNSSHPPGWENFFFANHLLSGVRGPLGHVEMARRCLSEALRPEDEKNAKALPSAKPPRDEELSL